MIEHFSKVTPAAGGLPEFDKASTQLGQIHWLGHWFAHVQPERQPKSLRFVRGLRVRAADDDNGRAEFIACQFGDDFCAGALA